VIYRSYGNFDPTQREFFRGGIKQAVVVTGILTLPKGNFDPRETGILTLPKGNFDPPTSILLVQSTSKT
jgi:hypothetical protein